MHDKPSSLKRIIGYTRPYRFWLIIRLSGAAINAAVDIFLAYTVIRLVDLSLAGKRQELLDTVYLLVAAILVGILTIMLNRLSSGHISVYVGRDIRKDITDHMGRLPVSDMETRHTGDLLSMLTNDTSIVQSFLDNDLPEIIFQPLRFAGAVAFMLYINWKLLLFSIFIIPAAVFLASCISKPMGRYAEELQQSFGRLNSAAREIIAGINIIKSFNLRHIFHEKYSHEVKEILNKSLSIEKRNSLMTPVNVVIQIFPFILCILFGGYLSIQGQLTPGGLLAFIQMMNYLVEPAQSIPALISNFRGTMGAASHLFSILDQEPESDSGESFIEDAAVCPVEFINASFSYSQENDILSNLNLRLSPGKVTALVGPSGCGKSTLIKLICGFYRLQSGHIRLFGYDLNEWNPDAARGRIAVVSQDTYLFPVSLAENISYGRPGATMQDIINAAKTADAHDFIMGLPEGYNTLAGEMGVRLSGGQKQRISIARAVLKDSPLLLLDEPASSLDALSEAAVQRVLEHYMQGRTVLIIAHRLSTIKNADEIIVLNEGGISGRGTHESLIAENGLYRQLYTRQLSVGRSINVLNEEDAV